MISSILAVDYMSRFYSFRAPGASMNYTSYARCCCMLYYVGLKFGRISQTPFRNVKLDPLTALRSIKTPLSEVSGYLMARERLSRSDPQYGSTVKTRGVFETGGPDHDRKAVIMVLHINNEGAAW